MPSFYSPIRGPAFCVDILLGRRDSGGLCGVATSICRKGGVLARGVGKAPCHLQPLGHIIMQPFGRHASGERLSIGAWRINAVLLRLLSRRLLPLRFTIGHTAKQTAEW